MKKRIKNDKERKIFKGEKLNNVVVYMKHD